MTAFLAWEGSIEHQLRHGKKRDLDLKTHLSSVTSALGDTFSENRAGTGMVRGLLCGPHTPTLMSREGRNEEWLTHSLTSQG